MAKSERRPTVQRSSTGRIRRRVTADDFSFTEQAPFEQGFAHVFRDRITPILRHHEGLRIRMRTRALAGIGVCALLGAGGGALSYMQGWEAATYIAPFLGVIGAFVSYGYYQSKWSSGLSSEVIPVLCDFLGQMTYGGHRLSPAEFEELGVVPYHTSSALDDTVNGTHHGLGYTLTEAKLTTRTRTRTSKGRSRTQTVFKGLIIRIELAEEVPGIFFARDRGGLVNRLSEAFSPVRQGREKIVTDFPEFEEHYESYSDDPTAAHQFITARLTAGLLEIAQVETGHERYIAAATRGRGFYLAIPRNDDFLGLGSLFRPLTVAEDDFHDCLADLALPRRVIETLGGG
jgi:hypothetical protein